MRRKIASRRRHIQKLKQERTPNSSGRVVSVTWCAPCGVILSIELSVILVLFHANGLQNFDHVLYRRDHIQRGYLGMIHMAYARVVP